MTTVEASVLDDRFRSRLAETLAPLGTGRHAPGAIYASEECFALEKNLIFQKDWLCVGREEEVAAPGDYFTFQVLDEPIIVARDADMSISAFANVCAHRGVQVASGSGNKRSFNCPYHGWNYDMKGRLIGAPYMKEVGFDASKYRLRPLQCARWAGWIFVNFDPDAGTLESFLGDFARDVNFLQMEKCRIAHKFTIDWQCNWKYVIENLQDVYHFKTVHAKTFASKVTAAEQFKFQLRSRGGNFSRYEGGSFTPDGKSLTGPMPWLAKEDERFACFALLPPNFHLLARRDFVRPYLMWPLTVDTSRAVIYHLFPQEHFAQPGFAENAQRYKDWYMNVVAEDKPVVQTLQAASHSDWFSGERMSTMEIAIHHFITNHIRRLMA